MIKNKLLIIIILIIILIIVLIIKNKLKENYEDNTLSEECNNNGYYNPISKNCECKSQEMLLKIDDIPYNFTENILEWKENQLNTNYKKQSIKLYSGEKCEIPIKLTSLNFSNDEPCEPNKTCTFTSDSSNEKAYKNDQYHTLYSNNLPLDIESYSNILVLKICPFHDGLKIKNIKINKGSILFMDNVYPLGENTGYQDVNNCKIIYQGYSKFPIKALLDLAGIPVIADSWTHIGGIDCDFTLVGKYNTDEEWSIDLNVKRNGFDILNVLENPSITYDLNLKVTYKDTGVLYDNYYVKNGTFDYAGFIPYGIGYIPVPGVAYNPPSPSMVVIGEPLGVYLNPFKKEAKEAGYEISDDSQIFLYLINNYVLKCDGNIYPWLGEVGFWQSFFTNTLYALGSYVTYIIPWLSKEYNVDPCIIDNDEIFNIRNINLSNNSYNSTYIFFDGKWITNTRGTNLSFIPDSILNWITKIKGILIFNDSPQYRQPPLSYNISFDIGTVESNLITKSNIPNGTAHSIAIGKGFGTCKYVYVIPWDGVKFIDYTINHGTNSTTWQWGGVWFESPFTKYTRPDTGKEVDIDLNYVFESVSFTGLDVIITVSQETDDNIPYVYQVTIKKGDCGYLLGPSNIEVIGTDNVQIEQPTIGYFGTDAYPGVVIIGKKYNLQSTIEINCKINSFPPQNPTLNFVRKDDRYEYFVKQPMVSPDYKEEGEYPGFIFITPKVNMKMLCTTDKGCNNKGKCRNYSCICDDNYYGNNCEYKKCLNNCSNRGVCKDGICICNRPDIYSGEDCSKTDCNKFVDLIKNCKESSCKNLNEILKECRLNNCDEKICSACSDNNDCDQNHFCLFNSDGSSKCTCKNWILKSNNFNQPLNCIFYNYDIQNNLYGLLIQFYNDTETPNPIIIFSLNKNNLVVINSIDQSGEPSDVVNLLGGIGSILEFNNNEYSNNICTLSINKNKC